MIEINKKEIIIYGENEVLKIFINSELTLKERKNALKIRNVEKCKNIILKELWEMKLREFPLNIWKEIQPCICNCRNFMIIYKKGNISNPKENFTFSVSKIYLNKIK